MDKRKKINTPAQKKPTETLNQKARQDSVDKGNELLIMTIEIGDGKTEELTVYENDTPDLLAKQFCKKHCLSVEVIDVLIDQIKSNLEILLRDENDLKLNEQINNNSIDKSPQASVNYNQLTPKNTRQETSKTPQDTSQPTTNGFETPQVSPKDFSFSPSVNNSGEKLYYKGLLLKEQTQKRIQVLKQQKDDELMKEATFRPKTNCKSTHRSQMPEIYLIEKGRKKLEHLERKRGEKLADELRECTFSPRVDKRSSNLDRNRNRTLSPNRHVALYENAKKIEEKQSKFNQEIQQKFCPFTPDTSLTSKKNKSLIKSVPERLANSRKTIEEYINRNKNAEKIVFQMEQPLFQPKVGRAPSNRDANPKNIGDRLYANSKKAPIQEPQQSPLRYSNTRSDKILEKVKLQRYNELFGLLNPKNGLISKETVQALDIPENILEIIQPLLDELSELNETLTYEEFNDSMELLMKELSPYEKSLILMTKKSKSPEKPECSFRPSINQSFSIEFPKESLYERHLKKMQEIEERNRKVRTDKEAAEMSECTFLPKTNNLQTKENFNKVFQDSNSLYSYKPDQSSL